MACLKNAAFLAHGKSAILDAFGHQTAKIVGFADHNAVLLENSQTVKQNHRKWLGDIVAIG
ncbi:MAG: hypothetical protein FWE41_06950 [Coriobacteriia bacterium]|nr:hypothetical protein [Coriobacteriia bacterium]